MTQHDSAESVLETFSRIRGDLISLLTNAETIAKPLAVLTPQVEPGIEKALAELDRNKLNLAIIGGEGVGKSTFINALLGGGEAIVSEVRTKPATVAPTYIEWGEGAQPTYAVACIDSKSGGFEFHTDITLAEFNQYMLQQYNPDNKLKVDHGTVRINRPILQHGLRLVDTPGSEGVSMHVSASARAYIKKCHTIIGITRERKTYGALGRLLADFHLGVEEGKEGRIQSIICNEVLDTWLNSDELGADSEKLAKFVSTYREDCVSGVDKACREHSGKTAGIDTSFISLLHLPSVKNIRKGTPQVNSAFHVAEFNTFDQRLWGYVRENGVFMVLVDGVTETRPVLFNLAERVALRERVLAGVFEGGENGPALVAEFQRCRRVAEGRWAAGGSDATRAKFWQDRLKAGIKDAMGRLRNRKLDLIAELEGEANEIKTKQGRINREQETRFHDRLDSAYADLADAFHGKVEEARRDVLDAMEKEANGVLKKLYHDFPMADCNISVPRDTLIDPLVERESGGWFARALDWMRTLTGVGTGAAVGGMVAGGSNMALLVTTGVMASPGLAAVAGGAGVALLAGLLVRGFTSNRTRALEQFFREERQSATSIDTEQVLKDFDQMILETVKEVADGFCKTLGELEELINTGSGQVTPELTQIRESQKCIRALLDRFEQLEKEVGHHVARVA